MNSQPARARGASVARAGFICGLTSLIIALIGGAFASGVISVLSSGEGVILLFVSVPIALIGLFLSALGYRFSPQRRVARTGVVLSVIAFLPFILGILVIFISFSRCQPNCF